jgi:hypothetical protein
MDIINTLIGVATDNIIGMAIGSIATLSIGLSVGFVWDKIRPLKPFTDYAKQRSNKFGFKTREFALSRIGKCSATDKILLDLENSSEEIQNAYVDGLRGIKYDV